MIKLLWVLAGLYLAWLTLGFFIQRRFLFPTFLLPETSGEASPLGGQTLWLEEDGARVEVNFHKASRASEKRPAPLVVFAHGNGERIDDQPEIVSGYERLGCHVLLVEYRSYGRSTGSPSQRALVGDFERALQLVLDRDDVDSNRLVFHGRSLGTGVVCGLAGRRSPQALVLQAPFVSISKLMGRFGLPPFAVRDPFNSLRVVREAEYPVLVLHGNHDSVVPFEHGQRLAQEAPDGTLIEFDADHNDLPVHGDKHWRGIEELLSRAGVL